MKLRHLTLLLCVSLSLTGCSALLERNYATVGAPQQQSSGRARPPGLSGRRTTRTS